jgi:hypothetical protein
MLVNKPADHLQRDHNDEQQEELLLKPDKNYNALPIEPPSQMVARFYPLHVKVYHLMWWLSKYFVNHVDIFLMYAEMGKNECTEIQITFQNVQNPMLLVTIPEVRGTGVNLTATKNAVITHMFWKWNEQHESFAKVVRLGQSR